MKQTTSFLLICIGLIVVTCAIYWQINSHEFINFDDDVYITQNRYIQKGLTQESIVWAFTTQYAGFWHPVTWLSHMVDYELYGLNAAGHHRSSAIIHLLSTLLLFITLHKMTGTLLKSALVAALFAIHPLHVESVAWAAERKDVLSTLFWILTLYCYTSYIESPRWSRYLLMIIVYVLGLMAKPMLVTLPFVFLLLDYWPFGRFEKEWRKNAGFLIREKIPLFLITFAVCFITYYAQKNGGAIKSLEGYPLSGRVINAATTYLTYLYKTFFPVNLSIVYPYSQIAQTGTFFISLFLLVTVTGFLLKLATRCPYLITGWLWYLGTLVPVIGLVQVGEHPMADRFTYVPHIGVFIIVSWGLSDIAARWRINQYLRYCFSCVLIITLTVLASIQMSYWKNSTTIFQHALDVTSNNYRAHNNLGIALGRQGELSLAILHFKQAIKIKPDYIKAKYNLQMAQALQNNDTETLSKLKDRLKRR